MNKPSAEAKNWSINGGEKTKEPSLVFKDPNMVARKKIEDRRDALELAKLESG